ncbi:MAG: hypothetical protein A2Y93_08045, partial [Chloroflexi bacterium RBG_13_68_17]
MVEQQEPEAVRERVRERVREYYAGWAGEAAGSCCAGGGEGCCGGQSAGLDTPVLSLGCADAVSAAGLQPGEVILDLGSGAGPDCFRAAAQVGPQGRVIGVDMTPEMLERAEAERVRRGLTQVEFRRGLIESIPLDDASVDVVISNCVINLSPDKPAVFAEIARVLRSGGRVSVADIVTHGPLRPDLKEGADAWAACVAGALPAEDIVEQLRRAGLADASWRPAD